MATENLFEKYLRERRYLLLEERKSLPRQDGRRKPVHCWENNSTYDSVSEASKAFGIAPGDINKSLQSYGRKAVKGLHFFYV